MASPRVRKRQRPDAEGQEIFRFAKEMIAENRELKRRLMLMEEELIRVRAHAAEILDVRRPGLPD